MSDWEKRYAEARVRCRGSTGKLKKWKWRAIKLYAGPIKEISRVIDVGCGDGRFWTWQPKPQEYHGIDVSPSALNGLMRVISKARKYNQSSAELVPHITAPVVLCIDLIFHIMTEADVVATLTNLTRYSTDLIFIYTWVKSPAPFDESFQAYYSMGDYDSLFTARGFELRHLARSPLDPIGGMYIYKKVGLLK